MEEERDASRDESQGLDGIHLCSGLQRDYRVVFLIGCPRSGTTWVQLLLDQNPQIATAPETQIFAYYLDQFRHQWEVEHTGPGASGNHGAGLSRLLSKEEFRCLCGGVALDVLDKIERGKPGATIVLEKSPRHALNIDWILDIFPEAYVLHIVRDPRDAVASIIDAGRTWGRGWAPRNPTRAARMWRAHVEAGRSARLKTENYLEIRYEDLRADPAKHLQSVLDWIGAPMTQGECEEAVQACSLDRMKKRGNGPDLPTPSAKPPPGFFGSGKVGGWEIRMGKAGGKKVESICYDLMVSCGYVPKIAQNGNLTLRVRIHDLVQRLREAIDWQLQRLLFWI